MSVLSTEQKLAAAETALAFYADFNSWYVLEGAEGGLYGGMVLETDIEPESVDLEYGAGGKVARAYFAGVIK
jgi:hypothetical protein